MSFLLIFDCRLNSIRCCGSFFWFAPQNRLNEMRTNEFPGYDAKGLQLSSRSPMVVVSIHVPPGGLEVYSAVGGNSQARARDLLDQNVRNVESLASCW